jgi:hypothetical protein
MIDFSAEYRHRKKDFDVIVSEPEWWDMLSRNYQAGLVVVDRLGYGAGRRRWMMNRTAFEKTYEKKDQWFDSGRRRDG